MRTKTSAKKIAGALAAGQTYAGEFGKPTCREERAQVLAAFEETERLAISKVSMSLVIIIFISKVRSFNGAVERLGIIVEKAIGEKIARVNRLFFLHEEGEFRIGAHQLSRSGVVAIGQV